MTDSTNVPTNKKEMPVLAPMECTFNEQGKMIEAKTTDIKIIVGELGEDEMVLYTASDYELPRELKGKVDTRPTSYARGIVKARDGNTKFVMDNTGDGERN